MPPTLDEAAPRRRGTTWLIAVAALVACAGTARLGVWQLDRAAQKSALARAVEARRLLPVLAPDVLSARPLPVAALVHRSLRARGRWLAAATVFLDNRPMEGRVGFIVVTPLALPDGQALPVVRGWVPRDDRDRARVPAIPTPDGEVEVTGRLTPWPSPLYDFGGGAPGRIRQNLVPAVYEAEVGRPLLPLALQLQPGTSGDIADLSRDWPAPTLGIERNRGYAAQWFAMSALVAGLYLWFQVLRPRRPTRRPTP